MGPSGGGCDAGREGGKVVAIDRLLLLFSCLSPRSLPNSGGNRFFGVGSPLLLRLYELVALGG